MRNAARGLGPWLLRTAAAVALALLLADGGRAQETVGPGPVTGPVNVPEGTKTVVGGTTITSVGPAQGVNVTGTGIAILDATKGDMQGPIIVTTVNGHALLANGPGTRITINNGAMVGTSGFGSGLVAIGAGALIEATGVTVNNIGTGSAGHGAVAESGAIIILHDGSNVTTSAFNSVALGASGAGSQVNADALIPVTTNGNGAMGVYMHDGGLVSLLPGSTLNLNGTQSVGIVVDNTTVPLGKIGSGLTINLNSAGGSGAASTGIFAVNGGNLSIADLAVKGPNAAAGVWAAPGSTVTLTGQSTININAAQNEGAFSLSPSSPNIVTKDGQVSGIFVTAGATPPSGLIAPGGTINSTGTTINVASNANATGVEATNGGVVNMDSNVITTTGTNSSGLRVDFTPTTGLGGTIIGNSSSVTTSGGGAGVRFNSGPATVLLTDTTVLAKGSNTIGMTALNFNATGANTFSMSGGSLVSEASAGMVVQGPINIRFTNGALAKGGNGDLIAALDNPTNFQQTNVQLSASGGSTLFGDAFAQTNSILDISLSTGSQWAGAAFEVTNVSVDRTSIWTMTDSSTVREQVTNAGLIDFTPPAGGFKTLTTKNYHGDGGTIGLNTFLGNDASPSDKLVINGGTAAGNSFLKITNANGPGDHTVANGILVVEAVNNGTTEEGAFKLAGPVVAGPFDYKLFRSGVGAPENWFLRSTHKPEPDEPPCPPPKPEPTPPNGEVPNFRPEVSLDAALPNLALLYGRSIVGTLHDRVGDEVSLAGPAPVVTSTAVGDGSGSRPRATPFTEAGPAPAANGAWGRVIGQGGNRDGGCPVTVGPTFDYWFAAVQAGFDAIRLQDASGARDRAGVYGVIGGAQSNVQSETRADAGSDRFAAYSVGGYWTHYGAWGWYLDGVTQGTFYDVRDESTRLPALVDNGWGFAASLEAGIPFGGLLGGWGLLGGLTVEPQAQLVYQTIDLGDARDIGARVRFEDVNSLAGRLGVRFVTKLAMPGFWVLPPALGTVWFRPNYWHEFNDDAHTEFSSAFGFLPFRSNIAEDWVELNTGLTMQVDRHTALYATGSYNLATDGNGQAWEGRIGLKVAW